MVRVSLSLILMAFVFATVGCGDSDDSDNNAQNNTNNTNNTNNEGEVERPDGSRDLISDEVLDELIAAGAEVNLGDSPPSIEGTFLFNDYEVVFSSNEEWPGTDSWCHDETTFTVGTAGTYDTSTTSPNCNSSSEGTGTYISGEDDCFTLYGGGGFDFEGCTGESVTVTSACLNEDGDMVDPISATKILELEGEPCADIVADGRIQPAGGITVVRQEDGVATRVDR